jgi:hypothetical protein
MPGGVARSRERAFVPTGDRRPPHGSFLLIDRLILKYVEDGARPDMKLARQYEDLAALRDARVAFDARLRSMAHRSQVTTHLHLMGVGYGSTDLPYNPERPTS